MEWTILFHNIDLEVEFSSIKANATSNNPRKSTPRIFGSKMKHSLHFFSSFNLSREIIVIVSLVPDSYLNCHLIFTKCSANLHLTKWYFTVPLALKNLLSQIFKKIIFNCAVWQWQTWAQTEFTHSNRAAMKITVRAIFSDRKIVYGRFLTNNFGKTASSWLQ